MIGGRTHYDVTVQQKKFSDTKLIGWGGVHAFPKGISLKVNVIAQLEVEFTYFEAAVQDISPDALETPPYLLRIISYLKWYNKLKFLSLRVFGLLSSSLLLFPQRFGRYILQPSSGVCRSQEPSQKNLNMSTGKKSYLIVVILVK